MKFFFIKAITLFYQNDSARMHTSVALLSFLKTETETKEISKRNQRCVTYLLHTEIENNIPSSYLKLYLYFHLLFLLIVFYDKFMK